MMRACEGNINPELLRRYSEKFQLLQNPEKLKNILHRIDKCRLLLEKDANKVNDLKNTFVIKDKEHENI